MITPERIARDVLASSDAPITRDHVPPGLMLEFGVATGATIKHIAESFPDRIVYGFDSFNGLPENWRAGEGNGHFACPVPDDLPRNVKLVIGFFQDTLPDWLEKHPGNVALLHIDSDLYSSAKFVLNALKHRLVPETVIAFDEIVGDKSCLDHEARAFAEFLNEHNLQYECIAHTGDKASFKLKRNESNMIHQSTDYAAITSFVQQGFALYRDVFERNLIEQTAIFFQDKFFRLRDRSNSGEFPKDVHGWSTAIAKAWERTELYERMLSTTRIKLVLQHYVGPDIAWMGHDAVFINVPDDDDAVTNKPPHQDAWAGTGMNSVFVTIFFTKVDKYNGLSICPGSHLQGLMPVKNRVIDSDAHFERLDLTMIEAGDVMVWHPLLLHYTTGHSPDNIRILSTSRVTSTEARMTSQERALGYRSISVGPLNQVLRLVGNDYLTPFRTYGGYNGVDRRLADLYDHSPFEKQISYDRYLQD